MESGELVKDKKSSNKVKIEILSDDVIVDLENAINDLPFPDVPQDALGLIDTLNSESCDIAEEVNETENAQSIDDSSCEEITENVRFPDTHISSEMEIKKSQELDLSISVEQTEMSFPSAPITNSEVFSFPNESIYSPREDNICYPDLISEISLNVCQQKSSVERLKPFTESEMSAHYYNHELHNYEFFVNNFIEKELKSNDVVREPLYILLIDYLTCRDNLCKNSIEFDSLIEDYKQNQEKIWNTDTSTYTEYGECQDGNPVSATHLFKISHFNEFIFEKFTRNINELEILTTELYATNVFNVHLYKTKIEHYVHSLCYHFSFLSQNTPIQLHSISAPRGPLGADFKCVIEQLKSAISVLFSFQRRFLKDEQFVCETRKWLEKLISVLLRVATTDDHLFIIHHIMRCPAGVGKWACHFIQPPISNNGSLYNQQYVDHMITSLAVILLPITDRDLFLQQMEVSIEENMWVIVDSDGEDSDENRTSKLVLKENDLVSFLNQIPFADIFRQIILIGHRDDKDIYDVNVVTDRDILRSIAISTLLVNLLDKGIANYSAPAYRQFCKRLSRLIKHTASYVTDHWQLFREAYTQRSIVDSAMLNRLQTEYDEFLLRVVNNLYTTQDRIGWQYLATLPFGMITPHSLWRLYQYLLHTNDENINLMSEEFMENLARLPDNDIYYFLTTITNMALVRTEQDWLFIQTIVLQLFQIGFVNTAVRDKCMKSSRILIANLTSKYPNLISDLIVSLKKNFVLVGKFSLYLFRELPISAWKPNRIDILVFNYWLLCCPLTSSENNLARYIILQLNWSSDYSGRALFLPREFHCEIAILVIKTLYTYAEEVLNSSGTAMISQGVRQVSSLMRNQTPEEILNTWAWQILSKLKLHLGDQPIKYYHSDFPTITIQIPDINSNDEHMKIISNGILKNQSVSFYVAVLMSNVGHSLPVISETCWEYCETLLKTYKYSQVLHILQLTIPYYLENIETLLNLKKFHSIIIQLVNADQTYMKMAKNLIILDFPGPILQKFAALIQYHIEEFMNLSNANQIIIFWVRVLTSAWKGNCPAIAFLLDKIFNRIFTNEVLKQNVIDILSKLVEILPTQRYTVSGGLSSLVSWMGYGTSGNLNMIPNSLLPRSSTTITHSPYFAYFALHIEEYLFVSETTLWIDVLKNLTSTVGKANVDAALKKACLSSKFNPIGSNCLPIYRWSQYGLEIAHDHPILPLFWQRFFRLYLQQISENNVKVCAGNKFFEGALNSQYLKRIKKKFQDCTNCFTNKDTVDDFEKAKNHNMAQLYKTFLIWLEEPRLHQPEVYLPALPALFNIPKLSEIIRGETNLWLEFVDFGKMRTEQLDLLDQWNKVLYRDVKAKNNRIICFPEDVDVISHMSKRLKSYDKRLAPPELILLRSAIPEIPKESLISKNILLDHLAEHTHVIVQFTRSYEIEKSEQNDAANKLLDAIKHLFNKVDVEVKLLAFCDTVPSSVYKRKTVPAVNCAGPATIRFQVSECRLNKTAEHIIDKCNDDFLRLLKCNKKNPPFQLIVACIVIELAAEALQKEREEVSASGDIVILNALQDVGVALFYKLACLFDSQVSEYFPTKLILRKIIDTLGQGYISGVSNECPRLLSTLMNNPKLAVILTAHFTPSVVSATTFVHLYRKVTAEMLIKPVDFILNVLTTFNVRDWLYKKKPKLAERSQLIEVLSNSLRDIGIQPHESLLPIHKILKRDLCEIFIYEFPEHYGEILHVMLKYSAEEKFSCDVWFDILNCLLRCANGNYNLSNENDLPLYPGLNVLQIRDVARKYALELRSLTFHELVETANILGSNFLKERLQYGLYGLYPKYIIYLEPLITLHSLIGHATVTNILQVQKGILADKICEKIWPLLVNLFSPWVMPYFTGNLQEPVAPWIQQLTDDRSVLLPWVPADTPVANKMMSTFVECLKFVIETLPASNMILSYICQWYIGQFAHTSVKEHVLTVVQNNLITLNWTRFIPTVQDLEWMLKVIDQYLPSCHSFLGNIFVEIPWNLVVQNDYPPAVASKVHTILLNLLIKLANEPKIRQDGKVSVLLMEARQYHWHLVDAPNYVHVLDWFVMSYDSRVILLLTDEDWNGIDMAAFDLLQVAAGYVTDTTYFHPSVLRKRQMFVKACVKMALQVANRYKTVLAMHSSNMESALIRMLDKMENVVNLTVTLEDQALECGVLLTELLVLVNQPTGSVLSKLMIQVLLNWLTHRTASSPVLRGILRIVGTTVTDHFHLGIILEASLVAWFKNSSHTDYFDWNSVIKILQPVSPIQTALEEVLLNNDQILSLYALTLKQLEMDDNFFIYSKIVQWITSLKPCNENESKLPLLWSLAFGKYTENIQEVMPSLLKLCNYFQQIINQKPGWALFGVIGMNKQQVPSLRCKLLCYALNAFILMKLSIENDIKVDESSDTNESNKNTGLVNAECIKAISTLDSLVNDKHYSEHRITIISAIELIKSKNITLGEGQHFIITLARHLYTEDYIHAFPDLNIS